MVNTDIGQLKLAIDDIIVKLPESIDESTKKPIQDYFNKLPSEIYLTDGQKQVVEKRCKNFERLPLLNLSDLNPVTLKKFEQFSTLIKSEPKCDIIKAITKLYLVFLEKWNPELMNCGKKLQEAFNELTKPVKILPTPSPRAIARKEFQLILLELLNEPRNMVYDFLNDKKEPIDKWFTDANLDKVAALQYETEVKNQRASRKRNNNNKFLQEFRQSLVKIAYDYALETNELISLLKYKNVRAYDDTRKYALKIEEFIKQNQKPSGPSFEKFLIKCIQITENDAKEIFASEVKQFSKLFDAYCSSISGKEEEQNLQQEIITEVLSSQAVTILYSSPEKPADIARESMDVQIELQMHAEDMQQLSDLEDMINPQSADENDVRFFDDPVGIPPNLVEVMSDSTMGKFYEYLSN
jgi:hypothetical protein